MSDKTLVERLREYEPIVVSESCAISTILGIPCHDHCINCTKASLNALADAIEREHLPRPRFEDGEPVQFGDEVFIPCAGRDFVGEVCEIAFDGEEYRLKNTDGHIVRIAHWEGVKRPEPEVLDADGVPIRKGDILYSACDGFEKDPVASVSPCGEGHLTAKGKPTVDYESGGWDYAYNLTHKRPVLDADGVPIKVGDTVYIDSNPTRFSKCSRFEVLKVCTTPEPRIRIGMTKSDGSSIEAWMNPLDLTHKQPDSLERIEEEMHGLLRGYSFEYKVFDLIDRMIKVMERDHER